MNKENSNTNYNNNRNNNDGLKFLCYICSDLFVICSAYFLVYITRSAKPTTIGFVCTDESIRGPILPETFSYFRFYITTLVICILPLALFCYDKRAKISGSTKHKIYAYLISLYVVLATFLLGHAITEFCTFFAKIRVGKLRPNFIETCEPYVEILDGTAPRHVNITNYCKPSKFVDIHSYINSYLCKEEINSLEARMSFMSIQASVSAYASTFTILFIQNKLNVNYGLWKVTIQIILAMFPFSISLARIYDYKHHSIDIILSNIMGVTIAVIFYRCVLPLLIQLYYNEVGNDRNKQILIKEINPNKRTNIDDDRQSYFEATKTNHIIIPSSISSSLTDSQSHETLVKMPIDADAIQKPKRKFKESVLI